MIYINNSKAYNELVDRQTNRTNVYVEKLELLEEYLIDEYPKIIVSFESYTKHDWAHTINVLNYMYDLLDSPKRLSEEDIMLMIYVALLHDIGMAWSDDEIKTLLPDINLGDKKKVSEIVRIKHGEFAETKVNHIIENEKLKGVFTVYGGNSEIDNWDLTQIVSEICKSHTKSLEYIESVFEDNAQATFVACLLRLGDLLDIDVVRATPFYKEIHNIDESSEVYFLFNQIVGDSEKIKVCLYGENNKQCYKKDNLNCENCCKRIELTITYPLDINWKEEAKINNMINEYVSDLKIEVQGVRSLLNKVNNKYNIKLLLDITCRSNRIHSALHPQIDTQKISIDYSSMKDILFEQEVYPNKLYGIREIIQNSYDACKAYGEILQDNNSTWEPRIVIKYESNNDKLRIRDNGIGMTEFVIKEYFLSIGKSIYNFESKYLYDGCQKDHIGHFGLGFFAAFMLSSEIEIHTQSYLSDKSIKIELNKSTNYATLTYNCPSIEHGTEVILKFSEMQKVLKINDINACINVLCQYITDTFIFDGISIIYRDTNMSKELNLNKIGINGWENISQYLANIDAFVDVIDKKMPSIFYAQSQNEFIYLTYDELLKQLATDNKTNCEIFYLDAGLFHIFSGNPIIIDDFKNFAVSLNPRRNYSPLTKLSNSLDIEVSDFCKKYKVDNFPNHCDYRILNLVVKGKSSALYERNVICSRYQNIMKMNDACGEPQRDDKIYLRDVHLPSMHISLPVTNFRYVFAGAKVNIKTDNVFPTLARNTLTDEKIKELSYAIGYAVLENKIEKSIDIEENLLIVQDSYNSSNLFIGKEFMKCLQ